MRGWVVQKVAGSLSRLIIRPSLRIVSAAVATLSGRTGELEDHTPYRFPPRVGARELQGSENREHQALTVGK